jgi:hypothetical protein
MDWIPLWKNQKILWHIPSVGRLTVQFNSVTGELRELFELEFPELVGKTNTTRWVFVPVNEVTDNELQHYITHTSEILVRENQVNTTSLQLRATWLEQALELLWQELARRADGITA